MGIEARNRSLPDWFTRIRTGQLVLPRFQRFEDWTHAEVVTLLDSVLRERPVGAALVLEVGDRQPFVSRPMEGAPDPTERPIEHLLDGQQRLTALWKALNDKYDDRTYFAQLNTEDPDLALAVGVSRWSRNGQRYPLWADQPVEQLIRGLVPMSLLNPAPDDGIDEWCDAATDSLGSSRSVAGRVRQLRSAVYNANLPFLFLNSSTPRDVAIDVFIKLNTTSVKLSAFDIIVAQFEGVMGQSLHDLEGSLRASVPEAERYVDVSDLVLRVAALRENFSPTEASFMRLDMQRLWDDWESIERGIAGAMAFLNDEHVFDGERLPTVAVVPVLASIWSRMPQSLDGHGQARTLLRQYVWRAFFTNRYERSAATAALQDYRGLVGRLVQGQADALVPILEETQFPIAAVEELIRAPWPKRRDILARGILAVSLRGRGADFADDRPATRDSLLRREYHHLFPVALLRDQGRMDDPDINVALNCALVTWNTNRHISAKEPIAYLRERVERADLGIIRPEDIARRVRSHTIPFEELNVGRYSEIADYDRATNIQENFGQFIRARALAIHKAALTLCNGEQWDGL